MSRFKIGIQLYSLRDEMDKDFEGTLKAVSEMGYDCVEFAGYYDHSAEEVKAICDKYNLEIASAHYRLDVLENETKEVISTLKTFGAKHCAIACISPEQWHDEYDSLVKRVTKVGRNLYDNGIQLIYHNHEYELLNEMEGQKLLDRIYSDIPTTSLAPQIDVCWIHYGGKKPVDYIKKYGDVEEVLHLKDFECKALGEGPVYELTDRNVPVNTWKWLIELRTSEGFEFRPIGYGRQDFVSVLKAAEDTCIKYIIVEQDLHYDKTGLEDARLSIDYLHSIGY